MSRHVPRSPLALAAVALAAAVLGGCAGIGGDDDPTVAAARGCVEELSFADELQVLDELPGGELETDAFWSAQLLDEADPASSVQLLVAEAPSERDVEEFEATADGLERLHDQVEGSTLEVSSGSRGSYVWVVVGVPGEDEHDEVLACVDPDAS